MVLPELPTINHISYVATTVLSVCMSFSSSRFQLSAAVRETINTAGAFEAVE